ncbi:glycosyltransferase family 9 protein [Rhodocyclus tenuis]|uniref:Glycosyltransferase family 9 protein n=1 Tax=Rhodocyclus gracilis TaxID=2929842 RepID=A0ABX0WJU5_9RHOO|nr:glycosyltransferase family 9 protein [Rhodocyclus gracilis]MRD74008.1 hypothetical protein [Rhodocyclus gracilis]NJA89984.1 glycosyltransferase family 9 protein [Rhodocyclus gracilis]
MTYLLLTWLLAPWVALRGLLSHSTQHPQRILLIQTAKIGDYICTTPIIRALRNHYPDAHLSVMVNSITEALARNQPGVDQVVLSNAVKGLSGRWKLYRQLRSQRFDTVICISPNQAFLLLPYLAGIERRASVLPNFNGRSYRHAARFLTASETHQQGRMMVETGMALIAQLGVTTHLPEKEIRAAPGATDRIYKYLPKEIPTPIIGVGVSSGNKLKELGSQRLTDLTKEILASGRCGKILLIGDRSDRLQAAKIQASVGSPLVLDVTGKIPLEDLPALIKRLSLYIGVDSGITYMADALNVPVVDIIGPADPEDQRPTGKGAQVIRAELTCAPCSHAFHAPYACAIGTRECVTGTNMRDIASVALEITENEARGI